MAYPFRRPDRCRPADPIAYSLRRPDRYLPVDHFVVVEVVVDRPGRRPGIEDIDTFQASQSFSFGEQLRNGNGR
jgi:hypothetical protein